MICPHCGNQVEQYQIVSTNTKNLWLNMAAGCNPVQSFTVIPNMGNAANPTVFSQNYLCNNGAAANPHTHYIKF